MSPLPQPRREAAAPPGGGPLPASAPLPTALPDGRPPPGLAPVRPAVVRVAAPELARRARLERTRGRLVVAGGVFLLMFGAVGAKLGLATLVDPAQPRRLLAAERLAEGRASGPAAAGWRAPIVDRNGETLAVSLPITALYANPRQIQDPGEVADRLLRILPQLDRARLVERLSGEKQFAYLARAVTPRERQAINDLGVPGLEFEEAERRYYPQGRTAVHLLGGVDVDGHGIAGVEKRFDARLRSGAEPLRLSIDIRVQLAMRDAVSRAIADFNGIGGAGAVLDVHTGEVLAMVSLPDYDINDVGAATNDQRFNRATVGVYEPGSTFKLFTAAMALEAGTVNVWGGYDASRPIRFGRFTINDYRGKGRWLALPEILAYSSNLASAHMAAAVGPQRHREFMGRMGMLARQGIELPETALPLAPSAQSWREINTMTVGFGHGISVTPLHVVTGAAALANGGVLRQPTLLAQAPGAGREGVRVISERTSETMRRLMRIVVTEGSGKGAEVPGYFVGGKTGTAQKTGPRGGYLENKRIAAFVGAFPMQAPRYAVYVMVDEPRPNARSHGFATAGWVAAPAAHAVVARIAPILGLVPETERLAEIQAQIAIPLRPARGGAPPRPPAAAATAPRRQAASPAPPTAPVRVAGRDGAEPAAR